MNKWLTSLSRPLSTEPVLAKCFPSLPSLRSRGLFSLFGWLRSGDSSVDWLLTGGISGPSLDGISSNFAPRNTGGRDTGRSFRVFGLGGLRSTAGASLAFLRTKYFSPYTWMTNKQMPNKPGIWNNSLEKRPFTTVESTKSCNFLRAALQAFAGQQLMHACKNTSANERLLNSAILTNCIYIVYNCNLHYSIH